MTRGEMKANIRYALGLREPEEQPMIEQAIHHGVLDLLRRTSCSISCIDADVPDDKSRIEFAAAGPIMKAVHVMRGGQRMFRVNYATLQAGAHPAFAQVGQILFFSASFSPGEQLQLYAVVRPPAMTADTDLFEDEQWGGVPEEFQDGIELSACARLGSRSDDGTSQMGASYLIQWVGQDGSGGRAADIRRQVNVATGRTLGPAQLITRNSQRVGEHGSGRRVKTKQLFSELKGMSPDKPRDRMGDNQVWKMLDWLPNVLGSVLESRSPWVYSTNGPLDGQVKTMKWVATQGGVHHLAATAQKLYSLDVPNSPAPIGTNVLGGYGENPMASLYEYVCVPRVGDQLPIFLQYPVGGGAPAVVAANSTIPKARFAEAWNSYFVVGYYTDATGAHPSRVAWLGGGQDVLFTPTAAFDQKAWWDTTNDVTGLARGKSAIIVFHADTVERLKGGIPPGTDREDDLWLESLSGQGGCTQPQTISYWNDFVLFCGPEGAYMTEGTQIRDLADNGGISRAWQERYQGTMRMSAGVYKNNWVISSLQSNGAFIDCWVCDLVTRTWCRFDNIPCSCLLAAPVAPVDGKSHLYGGTNDGKVIDLTRCWDEADPVIPNVDGNGTPVRPQLETAWYRMGDEAVKRIKNAYISIDLDEDAGGLNIYTCQQVQPRDASDWKLLRTMRMTDLDPVYPAVDSRGYIRRRLPLGLEAHGFAFKLETTGTLRNLKVYDFSVEVPAIREGSWAGA